MRQITAKVVVGVPYDDVLDQLLTWLAGDCLALYIRTFVVVRSGGPSLVDTNSLSITHCVRF